MESEVYNKSYSVDVFRNTLPNLVEISRSKTNNDHTLQPLSIPFAAQCPHTRDEGLMPSPV